MDFTLNTYKYLLAKLVELPYSFQTFEQFLQEPDPRAIILRHDVDALPEHSLTFAKIQRQLGIRATYYFRAVPQSWDQKIIHQIAALDHEIGYHYECLTTTKGNTEKAIIDFEENLVALRKLVPVRTICMHGSPMSKYDSKDIWKHYNYRDFGIIGEPYFDIDFSKVLYLSDTGRRWTNETISVRDKVGPNALKHAFKTTEDIYTAAKSKALPPQMMFTFHPQRWTNNKALWTVEYLTQNTKNIVKKHFFVKK